MKVNSIGNENINNKTEKTNLKNQSNPNFKGLLDVPGILMNGIEKGGFAASFIIQDTAGMTVPRTGEGLVRGVDKDRVKSTWNVVKARLTFREPKEEDKKNCLKLKELNFKEGLEVAIREGLSGPLMMFTPALVLLGAKRYAGKSTFTNSSMINRLGNKMTNIVKDGVHDSVSALKHEFYTKNITDMVKATTKSANLEKEAEFIRKATDSVEKLDKYSEKIAQATGKRKCLWKKAQERENKRLLTMFNDYHKTHSDNLEMLNRVKFDGEVYSTDKMIDGMRGYAEDSLKGKKLSDITESYTESFKKKAIAKRVAVNAGAAVSTIASLSVVPALYKLVNPVPPGALGAPNQADNNKVYTAAAKSPQNESDKKGAVNFTGRWDKLAKHLEFNGSQFTPALMTGLAIGGLMVPRVDTAAKRAPIDPVTKKKDYSEIPEILTRDLVSTAAVTFGVPMLSKAIIGTYEHATGFVLQNRPEKPMSGVKKVADKLNPFSAFGYYGIKDLDQIYGNLDTPEKLGNLSNFVDKNNGSLAKIFKTVDNIKGVFSEHGLDIDKLAKQKDRKAANKTIMDTLKGSEEFTTKVLNAIKPNGAKDNNILKRARSLNSFVSFASTVLFVPAFLGMVLPRMVYAMTAKRQKKAAEARALYEQQNNQASNVARIDYSTLKTGENVTFRQMRHS